MQKTLSAEARWQNLQGAFAYHGSPLTGRHVALLDDVLTTGATATHLSELLWQQGAARVTVICLARTLP